MDYNQIDTSEAVELARASGGWFTLADLKLQCHAYLIEQGDESVLIDLARPHC